MSGINNDVVNLTSDMPSMPSLKPDSTESDYVQKKNSWWNRTMIEFNIKITNKVFMAIIGVIILVLIITTSVGFGTFENKSYDPYGQGIRFLQSRDDTGSPYTSLEERQFKSKVSQLTSTPEAPNFSEYYGIDASIKNGSVMIERENFENKPITADELEMANKGLL